MAQYNQQVLVITSDDTTSLVSEILSGQSFDLQYTNRENVRLKITSEIRPDIVIIDTEDSIDLGIELCRSLNKAEATKRIPVIPIATLPELKDKENAFKAGCSDVITRPYSASEILVRINNCLLNQKHLKQLEEMVEKRTEQLKASQERFSKMFLCSPDATLLIHFTDGGILDINTMFVKMFGYSRNFTIGKKIRTLGLWVNDDNIKIVLTKLKQGQYVQNFELKGRRSTGEVFDVSISCDKTTIHRDDCLIVIIRDDSERKTAEKKKKSLETQLLQSHKMESIGTLAGGIAHDFNNILSAIVGYTQLAMIDSSDAIQIHKKLENILEASDRAKELVSQILTFSRNDEQKLKPLKIQLVIKEALKLLRSSLPSTIRIKQNIPNDCDMVIADPTQIHQVIMNICTNSYHAMKDTGGTLGVYLQQVNLSHKDVIGRYCLKPGAYAKITVSDTGSGIPENIQSQIFEPYYTTKVKGEGTGLGLAVVHGIITGLQGEIMVDSDPRHHTTFRIFLPVVRSSKKPVKKSITVIPRGNERILFIDDDPTLVEVNKNLIENLGYKVTALTNSLEALNLFKNTPDSFDLIITDMTMPYLTGDKLGEEILKIRPAIPIILSTGYSEAIDQKQAKIKGFKGYLIKPTILRHLAEVIRRCLDENKKR